MFLHLLKRAVKVALHDAVEQWMLECGLPPAAVEAMHNERLALARKAEAVADVRAALALDVEDDQEVPPALLTSSTTQVTDDDTNKECPLPGDEAALLHWIDRQREQQIGWADIAKITSAAGHALSEDALRGRYRRWREKNSKPSGDT